MKMGNIVICNGFVKQKQRKFAALHFVPVREATVVSPRSCVCAAGPEPCPRLADS